MLGINELKEKLGEFAELIFDEFLEDKEEWENPELFEKALDTYHKLNELLVELEPYEEGNEDEEETEEEEEGILSLLK